MYTIGDRVVKIVIGIFFVLILSGCSNLYFTPRNLNIDTTRFQRNLDNIVIQTNPIDSLLILRQ